jgi:hypothetical protein
VKCANLAPSSLACVQHWRYLQSHRALPSSEDTVLNTSDTCHLRLCAVLQNLQSFFMPSLTRPEKWAREPWPGVVVQSLPEPRYRLEPLEELMRCYCQEPSHRSRHVFSNDPKSYVSNQHFQHHNRGFFGGCILFCLDPRNKCQCLKMTSARLWH